mgnify:CR=1 FL=1
MGQGKVGLATGGGWYSPQSRKKKSAQFRLTCSWVAVSPSPIYHPAGRKGGSEETVGKYCDKECVQRAHHREERCPDKRPHQ